MRRCGTTTRISRIPSTNNIHTISSLGMEVQEVRRELQEIRRMIEIQTEVLEGLLNTYRTLSPRNIEKADDLITPRLRRESPQRSSRYTDNGPVEKCPEDRYQRYIEKYIDRHRKYQS